MGKSKKKKNPTPLPLEEVWKWDFPLSPLSESPAPSTPIHQTHSPCPNTLGQCFLVEDSVTVPRSQVKPGAHSFTPFVRRPQQHGGPDGDPPRSPSYPRQMPNGTAPRSQGGMPCPSYYHPEAQPDVYTPSYPSMPTQHQLSPPHRGTPVSPRNPSPSTAHFTTSIGSLLSPPPMPSSSSMPPDCLDGVEVNPDNIKNATLEWPSPPALTPSTSRQDSLWTTVRRPSRIRIESKYQRRQLLAKEEAKARAKAEADEKDKKDKEEAERKVKDADEERRKEEEAEKEAEKERIRREERKEKKSIRREEERKEKGRMKKEQERLKEAEEREVQLIKEEEERQRREEEETEDRHIAKGGAKKDAEEWLRKEQERNVAAPPLSTLATSRVISDTNAVAYPEGVSKLSSQDRFANRAREASVGWATRAAGLQFTHPIGMTQMASQGDLGVDRKLARTERNKAQNPNDAGPGPSVMRYRLSPEFVQHFPSPASPIAAPAPPQTPPANPGPLTLAPSLVAVNSEQTPLIPADRLPGADMNLDEFCAAYCLTDRVRKKLDDDGYCGTHTFQYVEWKDLREAGLKNGEIAQLKHAISKWSVPPGDGRG